MKLGDEIKLTPAELERVINTERRQNDERTVMNRRHSDEAITMWREIRKSHPESEGCVLLRNGDSLYVFRAPS